MSATAKWKGSKIVRVQRKRGSSGYYFASSDDLEGLVVSAKTIKELDDRVDDVIVRLYAACGVHVVVDRLIAPQHDRPKDTKEWVAMPAEVAKRALEKDGASSSSGTDQETLHLWKTCGRESR